MYKRQGGATSSTSKCVILSKSAKPGHDVDYLYGQVSIDSDFVDWSGNCGNLSTAAGAFALQAGYVDASRVPKDGVCVVRIWQANIGKTILAHVPVTNGLVQETGDFELDGVTFPAAEIVLEFIDPADGLIKSPEEAAKRQHTPKVAFVAPAADYVSSSGKTVRADEIDLRVRALSMGKLHHAMMGTAAVAIATAASIPGTVVNLAAGGGARSVVRFGHPSGTLRVGAEARLENGEWIVTKAIMSRSARILMEGFVRVPADSF